MEKLVEQALKYGGALNVLDSAYFCGIKTLFAALVFGSFTFFSCTSTFNITTKTEYKNVVDVNRIGTTQYTYNRIQTGRKVTLSEYSSPTTSAIKY